jgi:hypothetical protein
MEPGEPNTESARDCATPMVYLAARCPSGATGKVHTIMAIPRGFRFLIEFADAFPKGLVPVGEIAPDTEHQSREDRAAGRPVRQRVDEVTGRRQWKATVTDPEERNAKRASFAVTLLADVQPVPSASGVRPVVLDGLTAEPRVAGNGEFKCQAYLFRATRFAAAGSAAGSAGGTRMGGKSVESSRKTA